jgi:hypothetical protein
LPGRRDRRSGGETPWKEANEQGAADFRLSRPRPWQLSELGGACNRIARTGVVEDGVPNGVVCAWVVIQVK